MRKLTLVMAVLFGLGLLALAAASGCSAAAWQAEAPLPPDELVLTFIAEADGWVEEEAPHARHASSRELKSDTWPRQTTYLRFAVRGVTGEITGARVRLFAVDGTINGPALFPASNTGWTESTLSWANQPGIAGTPRQQRAISGGQWVDYDVAPLVRGDGLVDVVLVADSTDALVIASRETENAPRLLVSTRVASCGDGYCSEGGKESCGSCALDCGRCGGPAVAVRSGPSAERFAGPVVASSRMLGMAPRVEARPAEGTSSRVLAEARRLLGTGRGTAPNAAATPGAGGPVVAAPIAAGPIAAGPIGAGPIGAGPIAAGPIAAGPIAAGPIAAGPIGAGPIGAGPATGGSVGAAKVEPPSAPPAPEVLRFTPLADSYVEAALSRNFGSAKTLQVDGAPQKRSYLRFAVEGLGGRPASATLRLHVKEGTLVGPTVYAARSRVWSESSVNWENKPATKGAGIGDRKPVETGTWLEFDVRSLVERDGTYDFVLIPTSADGVELDSRETSTPPELVVTPAPKTAAAQ